MGMKISSEFIVEDAEEEKLNAKVKGIRISKDFSDLISKHNIKK